MSNTFFESGGKCPYLLIIRRADVLIYHFHRGGGGGGQMSEGANVLHSDQTWAPLYFKNMYFSIEIYTFFTSLDEISIIRTHLAYMYI